MATKITLDMEWDIAPPQAYRCSSITDGTTKKVRGFDSLSEFCETLARLPKSTVIGGHYVVSDIGMLVKWGRTDCLPANLQIEDSLLAARLLFNHSPKKDLKTMSAEHGWKYENRQKDQTGEVTEEDLEYCAKDAWASHHLWELLTENLPASTRKVLDINNKFQLAFLAMELAGLKFDLHKAAVEEQRLVSVLNDCVTRLPVGLSPSVATDDNELRAWLESTYTPAELKFFQRTKETKDLSVGVKYIKLLDRKPEGFDSLIEAREVQNFLSLYVQGKQRFLDANSFLYPSYKVLVLVTHRRSTEPSIQNWPKEARELIRSRWTNGRIVWGDFKQLEARLFAWQCQSKQLMADLIERGYIGIGSRVYGIDVQKGSPEYKLIKATVLATQYNMGPGRLRHKVFLDHGLKISFKESQAKLDKFFNTYPEVLIDAERRRQHAWDTGSAMSDVGAPVPLYLFPPSRYPPQDTWEQGYDGTLVKPWPIKQVENQAINYRTQQLAGYVTGCALYSMQDALAQEYGGWGAYLGKIRDSVLEEESDIHTLPIAEVHDELVMDSQDVRRTKEFLQHHMTVGLMRYLKQLCPHFDCPLDVDVESGQCWTKT